MALPVKGDGTIVIALDVFLANVTPCYADTWEEMVAWATGDPLENDIVEHLRARWRETSSFDNAVLIDDDGELCNGRHRVTASILEGATTIKVTADDHIDESDATEIALRINWPPTAVGTNPEAREAQDEHLDLAFGVVRSLPIGDTWTECDGAGMTRGELSMVYYWDPADADTLAAAVLARLAEFGVNTELLYAGPDRDPLVPDDEIGVKAGGQVASDDTTGTV